MQRFGRKVVYVVIGDGVEEEQAAAKVTNQKQCVTSQIGLPACVCFRALDEIDRQLVCFIYFLICSLNVDVCSGCFFPLII